MNKRSYEVVQLSVGMPKPMKYQNQVVETAFKKERVNGQVYLTYLNFDGDLQADQMNHGGPDKAVLGYSLEHYTYWKKQLDLELEPSAFGENITVRGLHEGLLCIGDVFELDGATIQVSQPRKPCFKVAASLGVKTLPALSEQTGYTGFYFRVLKEGIVTDKPRLILVERGEGGVSLAEINKVLYTRPLDVEALKKFTVIPAIAEKLRLTLLKKIEKAD